MISISLDDDFGMNMLIDSLQRNKGKNQSEKVKEEFKGTKYDKTMEEIINDRR
jgi:hypothetical protein